MTQSDINPRLILVTGANGFLGSEIVRQALTSGFSVRGTDLSKESPAHDIDYIQADILDPKSLVHALVGIDAVIHCAGLAHIFGRAEASTAPFMAVNATGTANIASAAVQAGIKHFVLISSVSVYGGSTPDLNESTPCKPRGPYAESKYAAEQQAIEVAKGDQMSLTILRMATLYGEGDPGNVARLMRTIDRGRFIWISDGSNHKSLIYRGDAARACLSAVSKAGEGVEVYNVSAPPCRMREVVKDLADALGRKLPKWYIPAKPVSEISGIVSRLVRGRGRLGSLHQTVQKWLGDDVYSAHKFEQKFDFHTYIDLNEGLRREAAWYRAQQSVAK